jgi:hypothetical protein
MRGSLVPDRYLRLIDHGHLCRPPLCPQPHDSVRGAALTTCICACQARGGTLTFVFRLPSGLSKQLAGFVQFPPQQRWDNEALDHCLAMTWLFLQPPEAFDQDTRPVPASAAVGRNPYAATATSCLLPCYVCFLARINAVLMTSSHACM